LLQCTKTYTQFSGNQSKTAHKECAALHEFLAKFWCEVDAGQSVFGVAFFVPSATGDRCQRPNPFGFATSAAQNLSRVGVAAWNFSRPGKNNAVVDYVLLCLSALLLLNIASVADVVCEMA
jgi:hypothetical protein